MHQKADACHAEVAMQAALTAYEGWRVAPMEERVSLLLRTSELLRERKLDFCAWLTYEVGKNWGEADADVGELGVGVHGLVAAGTEEGFGLVAELVLEQQAQAGGCAVSQGD